jgi:S1-C subfamily serine protease
VREQAANSHGGSPSGGGGGGYGPYFGSIPDFAEIPNGVRFADIRPESPAAKGGLLPGDIMTGFDGKPIENLYDFTYALRDSRVGQTVDVVVLRDENELTFSVTLGERP